jgi:hypothetical protein
MQIFSASKKIVFIETLRIIDMIQFYNAESIKFHKTSLPASVLLIALKKIIFLRAWLTKFNKFDWGDTKKINDSLKIASINAHNYLEDYLLGRESYLLSLNKNLKIDFDLILRKFIFSELLFSKYFFYELVHIYLSENPNKLYVLQLEKTHLGIYFTKFSNINLKLIKKYKILSLVTSISLIIILIYKWKLKVKNKNNLYENKILCFVGGKLELNFYKEILSEFNPIFITNVPPENLFKDSFQISDIEKQNIEYLNLSNKNWAMIKNLFLTILKIDFIKNWVLYSELDSYFLLFINQLFYARTLAPEGSNNLFVVFEHHDFIKTVRNEFLRVDGNYSIFMSLFTGHSLRFYPPEFYQNYDCLISSGEALEDTYKENKSPTKTIYRVGSTQGKLPWAKSQQFLSDKKQKLMNILSGNMVVTFLTPGVCKPTYESEVRLLQLARQVSMIPNTKVLIRPKIINDPEYWSFYENNVFGFNNLILTGVEFELLDFLDLSDLFITSYSTSACDVALHGAPIFFVDYLNQKDRFLFLDINKGFKSLQLDEDEALEKIHSWLDPDKNKALHIDHAALMRDFVNYLEHGKINFDEYKKCIIEIFRSQAWRSLA